jgi:hypothetical protein
MFIQQSKKDLAMNDLIKQKAKSAIIVDLSYLGSFADAQPIMETLSPYVGCFCLGMTAILGSFYSIILTADKLKTNFFLHLNLNLDPEQMDLIAAKLKHSGAAMVSVHCSSGIAAIKPIVDKIRQDSIIFREPWEFEKKIPEKKTEEKKPEDSDVISRIQKSLTSPSQPKLPIRPMLFAITVPSYYEPSTASPSFGDYRDRMRCFNALVAKPLFDGVICTSKNLSDYRGSDFDHVKKMVFDPPDNQTGIRTPIDPTRAIEFGADYLVFREPIINPPDGSSMVEETVRISKEIAVALEKRSKVIVAPEVALRRHKVSSTTTLHPLNEILKQSPTPPENGEKSKETPKKKKKIGLFSH